MQGLQELFGLDTVPTFLRLKHPCFKAIGFEPAHNLDMNFEGPQPTNLNDAEIGFAALELALTSRRAGARILPSFQRISTIGRRVDWAVEGLATGRCARSSTSWCSQRRVLGTKEK